jgi:hypothetical protein
MKNFLLIFIFFLLFLLIGIIFYNNYKVKVINYPTLPTSIDITKYKVKEGNECNNKFMCPDDNICSGICVKPDPLYCPCPPGQVCDRSSLPWKCKSI